MADPEVAACASASCRASILFVVSTSTGKVMPLDAAPAAAGTFRLDLDLFDGWGATYVPPAARDHSVPLYVSHFATCPDAPSWRRDEVQP